MVRSFNPQGTNSSIVTNTNFPPQSLVQEVAPPPSVIIMLFEDGDIMDFENGTFEMEYE